MPFIITTRPDYWDGTTDGFFTSRRAVATIEEAREAAYALVVESVNDTEHEGTPGDGLKDATYDLPESGGTIGPLPDGTVIEVEPVSWARIANAVAQPWPQADRPAVFGRLIDAYNARMESHASVDRYYSSGIFTARQEVS